MAGRAGPTLHGPRGTGPGLFPVTGHDLRSAGVRPVRRTVARPTTGTRPSRSGVPHRGKTARRPRGLRQRSGGRRAPRRGRGTADTGGTVLGRLGGTRRGRRTAPSRPYPL